MTLSRLHISVFLFFAAATWAAVLFVQGHSITLEMATPFATVVTVLSLIWLLVEHWLWRMRWFHEWFFERPDLRGTWKGTLQSDWIDEKTGVRVPPITCYFGVKQTLGKLQMHLMTPQSESWLKGGCLQGAASETGFEIVAIYENRPGLDHRDNSPMHRGALALETHGIDTLKPVSLAGEYWTDRKTKGTFEFTQRLDDIHTRYKDAEVAFKLKGETT